MLGNVSSADTSHVWRLRARRHNGGIRLGMLECMSMTTIKVSTELRDRINRDVKERGLTAASLIEKLLDAYERNCRMEAFGQAFKGADAEYWDEFSAWDIALEPAADEN